MIPLCCYLEPSTDFFWLGVQTCSAAAAEHVLGASAAGAPGRHDSIDLWRAHRRISQRAGKPGLVRGTAAVETRSRLPQLVLLSSPHGHGLAAPAKCVVAFRLLSASKADAFRVRCAVIARD